METTVANTNNVSPRELPASAAQRELLTKLGVPFKADVTVGQASDMITVAQATRNNMEPTAQQTAIADGLGCRRPAGANRHEYSSLISVGLALHFYHGTDYARSYSGKVQVNGELMPFSEDFVGNAELLVAQLTNRFMKAAPVARAVAKAEQLEDAAF